MKLNNLRITTSFYTISLFVKGEVGMALGNFTKFFALSAGVLLISGCASIFGDNTRVVKVDSNPQGAEVYIDNVEYGKTPATIKLPSYIYGGKIITLKKEGYADRSEIIDTQFQKVGILNIFFWPGFLIDGATGSSVKIDPLHLNINSTLKPSK